MNLPPPFAEEDSLRSPTMVVHMQTAGDSARVALNAVLGLARSLESIPEWFHNLRREMFEAVRSALGLQAEEPAPSSSESEESPTDSSVQYRAVVLYSPPFSKAVKAPVAARRRAVAVATCSYARPVIVPIWPVPQLTMATISGCAIAPVPCPSSRLRCSGAIHHHRRRRRPAGRRGARRHAHGAARTC